MGSSLFSTFKTHEEVALHVRACTDEKVCLYPIDRVTKHNAIPNLPWLIVMAQNMDCDLSLPVKEYMITELYKEA